jgi:hypothetical protein
MTRKRKVKLMDIGNVVRAIDVEKAFGQIARRTEEIRREYGSAQAYEEEFRAKHQANKSASQGKKRP